ncbi:MAG: hypothetical protein O3B95_04195 [Chloroflexi bacterium]|nr:hypothetical protein [Chloroflexota bacterium]
MLFMVELTHGPETCIASERGRNEKYAGLLLRLREAAADHGIRVIDGWSFPVGHRLWYVLEADDPQAISNLCVSTGVHYWNTVLINPVLNHDSFAREVLSGLSNQSASTRTPALRVLTGGSVG